MAATGQALALLGLGSSGSEQHRLDDYSDLDFFVIVQPGYKQRFLEELDWLAVRPVVYAFQNTPDGYKSLFDDGVFCEFAVFEPAELRPPDGAPIAFAAERLIWHDPAFDASILQPASAASAAPRPVEWLVGEALTNLYVGLGRCRRGEKLSALRFIEGYAVDRLLELAPHLEEEQPGDHDLFNLERRFEQRFPEMAARLPTFAQGYDRIVPSALAVLAFLDDHFGVNPAMKRAILALTGQ